MKNCTTKLFKEAHAKGLLLDPISQPGQIKVWNGVKLLFAFDNWKGVENFIFKGQTKEDQDFSNMFGFSV